MTYRNVTILGSTGSIGTSTLEVMRAHGDKLSLYGLVAGSNARLLVQQIREFKPRYACIADESRLEEVREGCKGLPTVVSAGAQAIADLAASGEADVVVSAIVGAAGLLPTLNALRAGIVVGIANKEPLVMAGKCMLEEARASGATILPIDSEHSALFQCLVGSEGTEVAHLRLTASGGPFRGKTRADLQNVTVEEALNHPTWDMGPKITIDSASLMNKALEVIEAHWLFTVPAEKIAVTVHPQSVIHSMVEYVDGSVLAQLGLPDMKVPIQYALSWPRRWEGRTAVPHFSELGSLTFEEVDHATFPSIELAWEVVRRGGTMGAVFNAANEVAVERFLNREIGFLDIYRVIEEALQKVDQSGATDLDTILAADAHARRVAQACRF